MGVSETCRATSARSAPSLAIKKLGLIAHPSMDQWPFHLETKPTAPPGCARSAAGVQVAAAGGMARVEAAGLVAHKTRAASGAGLGCWLRGQGETLVEPHTRSPRPGAALGLVQP